MRLLVSVASAPEAAEAIAGGADIIDAKDPLTGAIGAVSSHVLSAIHAAVAGREVRDAACEESGRHSSRQHSLKKSLVRGVRLQPDWRYPPKGGRHV